MISLASTNNVQFNFDSLKFWKIYEILISFSAETSENVAYPYNFWKEHNIDYSYVCNFASGVNNNASILFLIDHCVLVIALDTLIELVWLS